MFVFLRLSEMPRTLFFTLFYLIQSMLFHYECTISFVNETLSGVLDHDKGSVRPLSVLVKAFQNLGFPAQIWTTFCVDIYHVLFIIRQAYPNRRSAIVA